MGFLRDLGRLSKQARELSDSVDVADRMKTAAASMQYAEQVLGQMSAAAANATAGIENGIDAVATVTASRQTGALMNHNPVIELQLLVMMPSGVPVPVTCSQVVQLLHLTKAQVGSRVAVKVDPADANRVWVDWAAPVP